MRVASRLFLLTAGAMACGQSGDGEPRVRPKAAAEVYADCMQQVVDRHRPAAQPLAVAMHTQRDSCTARSGWMVDSAAYEACMESQMRLNNAFHPEQKPLKGVARQMRKCSKRAGHVR